MAHSPARRGLWPNLIWLVTLLLLLVAVVVVWVRGPRLFAPSRETPVVRVFRGASPAVVSLSAEPLPQRPELGMWNQPLGGSVEDFFNRLWGRQQKPPQLNLGTGIIVDPRGFIITNEHVVNNTSWIRVTLADGTTAAAEVWGAEPSLDLAVVKVETERDLPYLKMGTSSDIMIGEPVVVIGNPLGLGHTCTSGIVSSLHRSVQAGGRVYSDLVQIDAPVNPGNSGGPLLNIQGSLIGITSALNPQAEGIGFAIPMDLVRHAVDDLIQYHYVPTGWLGVSVEDLQQSGTPGLLGEEGVRVTRVEEHGPAARELKPGDIIQSWDDNPVRSVAQFSELARTLVVGRKVKLALVREGNPRQARLTAEAFPESEAEDWLYGRLGMLVEEGPIRYRSSDGTIQTGPGVFIRHVATGTPAMAAGLQPGDLVTWLNREQVRSRADFRRAVARLRNRDSLFIRVQREAYPLFVTAPLQASGERW